MLSILSIWISIAIRDFGAIFVKIGIKFCVTAHFLMLDVEEPKIELFNVIEAKKKKLTV